MTVTKESQGRLNAFPKEPEMELIENQPSNSNGFRIFLVLAILFLIGLIAFSFTIK